MCWDFRMLNHKFQEALLQLAYKDSRTCGWIPQALHAAPQQRIEGGQMGEPPRLRFIYSHHLNSFLSRVCIPSSQYLHSTGKSKHCLLHENVALHLLPSLLSQVHQVSSLHCNYFFCFTVSSVNLLPTAYPRAPPRSPICNPILVITSCLFVEPASSDLTGIWPASLTSLLHIPSRDKQQSGWQSKISGFLI